MADQDAQPDGLEAMAFQLLLHKITALERAVQQLPPLLKKIIDHLESQARQPEVPMATYAELYPVEQEEPAVPAHTEGEVGHVSAPPVRRPHLFRWFLRGHL